MARHIQPAKLGGLNAPQVLEYPPDAAATFTLGAPVAMQGCTSGEPDFGDVVQVAIADENVEFMAQVYDSGGAAVRDLADAAPDVGDQLGLVKVSGEWYIDEDDAVNVVAEITKVYVEHNVVLFKVIASARGFV